MRKINLEKVNEFCRDCNHLDSHTELDGQEDDMPLCGFALGLAHWQDAINWVKFADDKCVFKGLTQYEAEVCYFGGKRG